MGKIYTDKKGYPRYSDNNELVHISVMEKKIGRRLKDDEIVHHINEDKTDFRRRNLQLLNRKDHFKVHVVDKKKRG